MSVAIPSLRAAIAVPPWVKNELWRKAQALPSLDLRFADSKSLVDAVTGASLVTFTRASSGTFVNSAGVLQTAATDVPRFDHNPVTGESLGLLVEEQRANLLLQSESFNTTWSTAGSASIAANQILAPDGLLTADLLTTPSGGLNRVVQAAISVASTTYSSSMYVKSGNINGVTFRLFFSGGTTVDTYADFIFASNSFTNINGIGTFTSQNAGGGWFRITCTVSSGNNTVWEVRVGGLITTAQTGTTAYLWGAQIEPGAFPTSYIPTTTAAVTRSADVASISGSNYSGWAGVDRHTLYAEIQRSSAVNVNTSVASLSDGTLNNTVRYRFDSNGTTSTWLGVTSGTNDAVVQVTAGTAGLPIRAAGAAELNSYQMAANGTLGTQDTSALMPSVNRLEIGAAGGMTLLNGTIRRLAYWGQRLPNNVLQQITQ